MTLDSIRAALATWHEPQTDTPAPESCHDGRDARLHCTRHLREWCQFLLSSVDELNARLIERTEAFEEKDRKAMRLVAKSSVELARAQATDTRLRELLAIVDTIPVDVLPHTPACLSGPSHWCSCWQSKLHKALLRHLPKD